MSKLYHFKQAIRVGRQAFPLGIRAVPPEIEKHPHFLFFVKAGSIAAAPQAHVGMKLEDLPKLPPASSAAAKRSEETAQAAKKNAEDIVIPPEEEIGGDSMAAEPVFPDADVADEAPKKKGKGK